nr:hypothetical protein CFP56_29905 [Quercus suber]
MPVRTAQHACPSLQPSRLAGCCARGSRLIYSLSIDYPGTMRRDLVYGATISFSPDVSFQPFPSHELVDLVKRHALPSYVKPPPAYMTSTSRTQRPTRCEKSLSSLPTYF